ncbi:hypothetical protein CHUAL_003006 [Chamberlinius hualienensis]
MHACVATHFMCMEDNDKRGSVQLSDMLCASTLRHAHRVTFRAAQIRPPRDAESYELSSSNRVNRIDAVRAGRGLNLLEGAA